MNPSTPLSPPLTSRWPHRVAVLLVVATFPLIWVGGLVTTYDAGMAVPDWPTTYGYNLFLYPWQTWLLGPWELFIEHGHRLLGAAVGMITIGLAAAVLYWDRRRWMWALATLALAAVVFQGFLGGARVLLDHRALALAHGCLGPLFFALAVTLAAFTARYWQQTPAATSRYAERLRRLAAATAILAYLQLVVGAHLRHVPIDGSPQTFRMLVWVHLALACVVAAHAWWLAGHVARRHRVQPLLARPAMLLAALLAVQLMLGGATWVVKYAWPYPLADYAATAGFTLTARAPLQANTVTAHVAMGSLIVGVAALLAVRSHRLVVAAQGERVTAPRPGSWKSSTAPNGRAVAAQAFPATKETPS